MLVALFLLLAITRWPSGGQAPTARDAAVLLGATGALALLAALLVRAGRREAWIDLGDIQAQAAFRQIARLFGPPSTAAVLTAEHTASAGDATAVFVAMMFAGVVFGRTSYPLHLSGVARFSFDLVMPAAGLALALVASAVWQVPLDAPAMVVPLIGACFITFVGGWLEEVFNAERPVRLAVIGEPRLAQAFAVEMENAGVRDHRVVGWISGPVEDGAAALPLVDAPRLRWLGSIDRIRSVVLENRIDLLVVTPRRSTADLLMETVERCVDLPVRMVQAAHLYEAMHGRVPTGAINAAWFAYIMHPSFSAEAAWSKRMMDRLLSAGLLLALAPLMLVIAAAVKLGDGGPVLFRQSRVGLRGRQFHVLKFRTMTVDAELPGEARWSAADDDRVTPVGRVLRKSHLDELPQLLNVLTGSMSLVGPRPERPELVAKLDRKIPHYSRRVLVKPGITGWAQVRSGYAGSDTGTAFKLSHDLYYIKHRSVLFDLLTMVETVRTLFADEQYKRFTFSDAFILGAPAQVWPLEEGEAVPELVTSSST